MTTKYTKRQMNQDIAEVSLKLEAAVIERNEIEAADEAGQEVDGNRWNELHTLIDSHLPGLIADIKRRFARRNWTSADYITFDLMTSNID